MQINLICDYLLKECKHSRPCNSKYTGKWGIIAHNQHLEKTSLENCQEKTCPENSSSSLTFKKSRSCALCADQERAVFLISSQFPRNEKLAFTFNWHVFNKIVASCPYSTPENPFSWEKAEESQRLPIYKMTNHNVIVSIVSKVKSPVIPSTFANTEPRWAKRWRGLGGTNLHLQKA